MRKFIEDYTLIDLFPYKIKNREAFYFRNHPKNLVPDTDAYKEYWKRQIKRCVVGHWINDNGTWVYMFPALYWYINITKISTKGKRKRGEKGIISPRLRDNEWIYFTYDMCTDGFSGFELDEEVTCNEIVGKIQNGEFVDEMEIKNLSSYVYKKNGDFKKYINPWDYLTKYYLIENPPDKPLGNPLYENSLYNGLVVTSRGLGKSLMAFPGKALHTFTFNGIKYWEDYKDIEDNSIIVFTGSPREDKIRKSLEMMKLARRLLPGSYTYYDEKGDKIKINSPFYVNTKGSWRVGEAIVRGWKEKGQSASDDEGSGTSMEFKSMRSHDVATGDRYYLVLVEEVGLLKFLRDFYSSVDDSMRVGDKIGKLWMIGTGGDIEAVQDTKHLFQNPEAFDIFSIHNYWNPTSKIKKIGLFIPLQYQNDAYKDENGNTDLEMAHKAALRLAEKKYKGGISEYKKFLQNNPFIPKHIFYSNTYSVLPSEEASNRVAELESGEWSKKARIGWFKDDLKAEYGVRFIEDPDNYIPINSYLNKDPEKMDKDEQRGAIVIYEMPIHPISKGLYKIVIDTVAKAGTGTSFNSVIVYKGYDAKGGMQNTIVAEWLGRIVDGRLEDTYNIFIQFHKFFQAKLFPEVNLDDFVKHAIYKLKMYNIFQRQAYLVEKSIFSKYSKNQYGVGYRMRGRKDQLKGTTDLWQKDWLLEEVEQPDENAPPIRVIDTIYSIRYLNEIANYTEDGNFDHISSARGLMIWLQQELMQTGNKDVEAPIDDDEDNEEYEYFEVENTSPGIFNY